MAICSICTATAIDAPLAQFQFCRTCAGMKARAVGIDIDTPTNPAEVPADSEAYVTLNGERIATIQWYMGDVRIHTQAEVDRIPEIAKPFVINQMRFIQFLISHLERPEAALRV